MVQQTDPTSSAEATAENVTALVDAAREGSDPA